MDLPFEITDDPHVLGAWEHYLYDRKVTGIAEVLKKRSYYNG